MPKFICYARVSTEKQEERFSIDSQLEYFDRVYEQFDPKHEYDFVKYTEAESGKSRGNRHTLEQVLNTVEKDDVFVVYDTSRIGRKTGDNLAIWEELTAKGAYLFDSDRIIDPSDPNDEAAFTMRSMFATYQRKVQNIKSRAGIAVMKKQGLWRFTGRLFGYRVENEKVFVVEDEASIVRYIFEQYSKGKSINSIASELNHNGIRNRKGTRWHAATIRRYILKPIYMGYYQLDGPGAGRGQERVIVRKGELVKSKLYPPLVTEELWWKCHTSYRQLPRKHARQFEYRWSAYSLSSIISCGHCSDLGVRSRYVHNHTKSGSNSTWESYVCRTHHEGCGQRIFTIRAEVYEALFRFAYFVFLANQVELTDYFENLRKKDKVTTDMIDRQISLARLRIQSVSKELEELAEKAIAYQPSPEVVDGINKRANQLSQEKQEIEHQIELLEQSKAEQEEFCEEEYYRWVVDAVETKVAEVVFSSPSGLRDIYKTVISTATIQDNKLRIAFVNSKELIASITPTKGRRIQRVFDCQVYLKGIPQYRVIYDTTNGAFDYHTLSDNFDSSREGIFKNAAENQHKAPLQEIVGTYKVLQETQSRDAVL